MSQTASSSSSADQARPATLLVALRQHFEPTPLMNKLHAALEIFAHLELISRRISSEARQAVRLSQKQRGSGSQENKSVVRLSSGQTRRLTEMAISNESRRVFPFSLEIRRFHIAQALSIQNVDLERVYQVLDTYFPCSDKLDDSENSPHLYIRSLTDVQRDMCKEYRKRVMAWYDDAKTSRIAGRPGPCVKDLIPGSGRNLEVHTRNILKQAEEIVQDAAELMAMFGGDEDESQREPMFNQEIDYHQEMPWLPAPSESPDKPSLPKSSRQSLPNATATSSRLPNHNTVEQDRRATLGSRRPASPAKTSRRAIHVDRRDVIDLSKSSPPPIPNSPKVKTEFQRRPRASAPDFTKPIGKLGQNVPKASMKPFEVKDSNDSKRQLPSDARGGDEKGNATSDVAVKRLKRDDPGDEERGESRSRQILGKNDSLENSQSSGESQETKNRRREEKGKGKAPSSVPDRRKGEHSTGPRSRSRGY